MPVATPFPPLWRGFRFASVAHSLHLAGGPGRLGRGYAELRHNGVLRNSHQTWATGIMLVVERLVPPRVARGASESPRGKAEKRWTHAWGRRRTLSGSKRWRV